MKARILNNELTGIYTNDFISKNLDKVINGQLVSEWELTEILPSENLLKPLWNGTTWIEGATPEEIEEANKPIVPESISQMKLRKQLILSGIAISSIDALIQSLPQPNRDLIYTMWEYAVVFDRHNPELNAMAGMLGVTQQQLDEIFINGNLL
jgi:hypothetical protein